MVALDLDPLRASVEKLRQACVPLDALPARGHVEEGAPDMHDILRSAVVKNFEVAYEVACKSLRRGLLAAEGEAALEQLRSRRDLFRAGAACGLVDDPSL